jgi:hypothetical protein
MAAGQRVKGQEVVISVISDGQQVANITAIKSFSLEYQTEIKKEGYLGETTDRRDDLFNGVSGDFDLHFGDPDVFVLIDKIQARARRRQPGIKFNILCTLNLPNGQRVRISVPDVYFGPIPVSAGSRSDYVSVKMSFEAQEAQRI